MEYHVDWKKNQINIFTFSFNAKMENGYNENTFLLTKIHFLTLTDLITLKTKTLSHKLENYLLQLIYELS